MAILRVWPKNQKTVYSGSVVIIMQRSAKFSYLARIIGAFTKLPIAHSSLKGNDALNIQKKEKKTYYKLSFNPQY